MSVCIFCHENGNLVEYNHCGNYFVHNKCLYKWYYQEDYKCFICKKYDNKSIDFFHILNPKYLDETTQFLIVFFLIIFYIILFFIDS